MKFANLDKETEQKIVDVYLDEFTYAAEPEEPLILCGYEYELIDKTETSLFVRLYQITTTFQGKAKKEFEWTRWKLNVVYELDIISGLIKYTDAYWLPSEEIGPDISVTFEELNDPERCYQNAMNSFNERYASD